MREGCIQRFRPVMMTATVALLGLVPSCLRQDRARFSVPWPLW
ncbi:hypothetical protein J4711_13910 [Staphylococcus epidermidis]|nr:hypothetical protein [Staphylococcus epidermidis]